MTVLVFSARVVSRPGARRELLQALVAWTGEVRRQPGVAGAFVYEDAEDATAFRVEAEWADAGALEGQLRSGAFGALLGAFELLAQPPRLLITSPLEHYGSDPTPAIRSLRNSSQPPRPESQSDLD